MDPPSNMEEILASIDTIDSMHFRLRSKATLPKEIPVHFDSGMCCALGQINHSGETFNATATVLGYKGER